MLRAELAIVLSNQVNVFVAPNGNINGLFIQVKDPSLPQYGNEKSMFGKTIRLLLYLEQKRSLLKVLNRYGIAKVVVTEAANPQLSNKQNTTVLNISFLQETFKQLALLANASNYVYETGIQTLIAENKHL